MARETKIKTDSCNVFRDLGFQEEEAQNLLLRSELMMAAEAFVKSSGLTQSEAAKRLGVTQPRLNDLLRGKIGKFSLDALVNMLAHAGIRVELHVDWGKAA